MYSSKSKPLNDTEVGDDTSHPPILSCAAVVVDISASGASAVTTVPAVAIRPNPSLDSTIAAGSDASTYSSAVLKFFEPSSATISKMKAKGWTFPSTTNQAHRLLGLRLVNELIMTVIINNIEPNIMMIIHVGVEVTFPIMA
jgi:hypothetical protein